ncbi:M48 family metalloprotease [Aquabacterium sp.]|uniref:M48 family metalloprotease n=1 Tax=Aquabacterium sp. TaxID=1872578 RepID=UPI002BF28CE9|nr:M48 family metalloprotease [Aquabacterium sp.]HSW04239.1 M48 family metalloprotease [Aquabacterium sp.]
MKSSRSPRLRTGCLLLALAFGLSPSAWPQSAAPASPPRVPGESQVRLPALGESASDEFSLSTEKRVGEQIMREIRRDPDYLEDPILLEYLQSLWQPLVAAARQRGDIGTDIQGLFPFESFLVRDRNVNAFALPGGYVGINLGLIAMTVTRDELASVLAHELSHVTQRHIARSITAASRSSAVSLAAMLLGILAAAKSSNADMAQAAIVGGQAAAQQAQLNFSRDMEREADRNGLVLMSLGGFAPSGMAAMFEKLDQSVRLNDSGGFPYLRSHPLTIDRIGEARQRIDSLGPAPASTTSPLWHALMQSRARVLMDPSNQSLHRFQQADIRGPASVRDRLAALYLRAMASVQLRDFTVADQALAAGEPLLPDATSRRAWAQLSTEAALARGDATRAAAALERWADDGSRSQLLLRAQLVLLQNDAAALKRSAEQLQTWVAEHRDDGQAWQALAGVAERQGQSLRSVRAQAEAQAAIGNIPGAIDRLRAGQLIARRGGPGTDFIEASVIDARLRDLVAQRRQLMSEQRGSQQRRDPSDNPE